MNKNSRKFLKTGLSLESAHHKEAIQFCNFLINAGYASFEECHEPMRENIKFYEHAVIFTDKWVVISKFSPLDEIYPFTMVDGHQLITGEGAYMAQLEKHNKDTSIFTVDMNAGIVSLNKLIFGSLDSYGEYDFHGDEAIDVVSKYMGKATLELEQENISATPAKIIQLWAYKFRKGQAYYSISEKNMDALDTRIYDLIRNDIPPALGLQSLLEEVNPDEKDGIFTYSIDTLRELSFLPRSYTRKIIVGESDPQSNMNVA